MTEDPFSTSASAPGINKIPFLVFDAILVITALALAFSAKAPLSPLMFFWILLCVAAGGLISCLPFWIEFRDRVRLRQYEISEQQNNPQDSQLQYVDARLTEQADALQKLNLRMAESVERLTALEARPQAPGMETIAALCDSSVEKQGLALREELLGATSQRLDAALGEQQAQNTTHFTSQEDALAQLQKESTAVKATLSTLEAKIEELALLAASAVSIQNQSLASAIQAEAKEVGADAEEANQSATTTAEPKSAEPEATAADSSAAAIEPNADASELDVASGEPGADASTESSAAHTDTSAGVESDPVAEALSDSNAEAAIDPVGQEADEHRADAADDLNETAFAAGFETTDEADQGEQVEPEATQPDALDADSAPVDAVETAEASVEPVAKPAPPSEQPSLLETPEPPARAKASANKDKTTLVAQVLIGIGNKPYVRGIGPGLSLEKGVPMQFVEIGKWEWVSPNGHEPVSIQIYKNDEVPSTIGEITIEPGQRRAVTPTFPK